MARKIKFAWSSFASRFAKLKTNTVQKMFWGRGSWYKNSFHLVVVILTLGLFVSGVVSRLAIPGEQERTLEYAYGAVASSDFLSQGSSLYAVVAVDASSVNYTVYDHRVESGETLSGIAKQYEVSEDTILWANDNTLNPFNPVLRENMQLKVPEIDGVLYRAEAGDTAETVANKTRGNVFDIVELNELVPPDYKVEAGRRVFVPLGELPPEPIPELQKRYFAHPLTHPSCQGYRYVRGFTSYHSGIDWARGGGCPIRSIAPGVVKFAGWSDSLAGYTVIIEHGDPSAGNSIQSRYYHGDGQIWVKEGDYVKKGQNIMHMGNTGNSTGTHLHLTIRRNYANVNPASYMPYL